MLQTLRYITSTQNGSKDSVDFSSQNPVMVAGDVGTGGGGQRGHCPDF